MTGPIDVACLVLVSIQGRFLATLRPPHKTLGNHWEFPGGKVESGERPELALRRELREELHLEVDALHLLPLTTHTYDFAIILVSFIKWSGLRLLVPAFENLSERGVDVRIITTSYMGASDPEAIEWLASKPRFSVKVSYDIERTRLHAKAYHFVRRSGFSTAYIRPYPFQERILEALIAARQAGSFRNLAMSLAELMTTATPARKGGGYEKPKRRRSG